MHEAECSQECFLLKMLSREAVNPWCAQTRHETASFLAFCGIFLVYQRNKWKHQFCVVPLPQEDIWRIWGYQVLRAWTIGWGKGEAASSFRYQVQRMRMRLLLPGNLGAAESVSLPGDDPGSCGGTSSVVGYQFSHHIIRFQTWTVKDLVLQATPGEQFWKYQSFGGRSIRKVLIVMRLVTLRCFYLIYKLCPRKNHIGMI